MGIVRGSSEPLEEGESAVAGQYYAKRTYPVRSAPLVVLLLLVLYVFSPWRSVSTIVVDTCKFLAEKGRSSPRHPKV